jgi:hypothetical protein
MQSKMTTLGEVSDRVDHMSFNCHDKFINVRDISFDSLETIKIGSDRHNLQQIAQQEIANRLGVPITYLRKCDPELQAYNLNHWIEKERNHELFFRFDGEDVRAIFTGRYRPVDNFEVLEKLDSIGFGPETKVQVSLDHSFLQLNIPDSQKTFSVNGDKLTPGISISNSEVGISSLSLSAFYLRLICTNGLISKTSVSASYRHISLKILSEFPQVVNKLSYELDRKKDQFRISLQSPVSDPLSTINSFNRQFQLGKPEKEAVSWAWPQEQGETMFHIINAYTKASQFKSLSAHESYHLQKIGGDILALVK